MAKYRTLYFLAHLFEEHGKLLKFPRCQRQRKKVKVVGATNVKACYSFNIYTRVNVNVNNAYLHIEIMCQVMKSVRIKINVYDINTLIETVN